MMSIGFFCSSAVARVTKIIVIELPEKILLYFKWALEPDFFNILESPICSSH